MVNIDALLGLKVTSILISIVAILGNALVCHVIVRVKSMKTSMNYIILNLAILDVLIGIFTIYYQLLNDYYETLGPSLMKMAYNKSEDIPEVLCKFEDFVYLGTTVSPWILTTMAYERYKAIASPLSRLRSGSTKRIKRLLYLPWLWGLGWLVLDISIIHYLPEENYCEDKELWWYDYRIYEIVIATTNYLATSITMLVLYWKVIKSLSASETALRGQAAVLRARANARKKVVNIIVAVTLTFYICCGIPAVLYSIDLQYPILTLMKIEDYFDDMYFILLALNSALNPFMYFILMQSFREGFRKTVLRKKPTVRFSGVSFSSRQVSLKSEAFGDTEKSTNLKILRIRFRGDDSVDF